MSKLNILGGFYRVKAHAVPIIHEGREVDGLCDFDKRVLDVAIEQNTESTDSHLIHEMVHAMLYEGGLDKVLSPEVQEILCQQIPNIILTNFRLIPKKKL